MLPTCPAYADLQCNLFHCLIAGHLELQATSLLLERNICIYQAGQPVWRISNFNKASSYCRQLVCLPLHEAAWGDIRLRS